MEYIHCNLCGRDETKLLFRRRDDRLNVSDQAFNVVQCNSCSLVYVNPRPTEGEIVKFYNEHFYEANLSPEQSIESNRGRLEAMHRHVKDLPAGRLLDVGCFKGEFPYFMKRCSWEVHGVEFASRPPNLFELDIHYGPIETAPFEQQSFDLITMWAVLEHVYDPRGMLEKVGKFLKPAGRLVILVPNFNSIQGRILRHDDVPRHLTMFTKHTLTHMLGLTGYRPVGFKCSQDMCGGSTRGLSNFMVKALGGEDIDEILDQFLHADRWSEFSRQIRGKDSRVMECVDTLDQKITPWLDRILDKVGLGFIMTVDAVSVGNTASPEMLRSLKSSCENSNEKDKSTFRPRPDHLGRQLQRAI